jgi:uncharacterized protein YjbI with pentapeptide repeats
LFDWFAGVLVNLGAGVIGSCVTFYLIDVRLNRQRAEEDQQVRRAEQIAQQEWTDDLRRRSLIAQLRSQNIEDARPAVEELRLSGWLTDGSLRNVDLSSADLRGLDLTAADLAGSLFRGADLRGVDFTGADLCGCSFVMADLRGWVTRHARMDNADFTAAKLER